MRAVMTITRHDLLLTFSDRSAVVWMFIMPVVFATFFGMVMGGGSDTPADPQARLTLVDADQSAVSRALVAELASERLAIVEIQPAEQETTPDKIRTLVIPEGFAGSVLAGEQVKLRLEKDPDTSAEAALVAQARIVAAIAQLLARLVEASEGLPDGEEIEIDALGASAADIITVESRFAGRARVVPDGFSQSIPGNAVMFVMLVALTYGAASITSERTGGQLRRLATAPISNAEVIAGKLGGRLVIAGLQVTVFAMVGAFANLVFAIEVGNLFSLWVVLMAFALTVAPLGLLVGALFTDADRAASIGVIITMVMAAFGGCWWPLEMVSRPLQLTALAFPTGWAMKALHGVISFGNSLVEVAPSLAVLLGFFVVFTVVAMRVLRID